MSRSTVLPVKWPVSMVPHSVPVFEPTSSGVISGVVSLVPSAASVKSQCGDGGTSPPSSPQATRNQGAKQARGRMRIGDLGDASATASPPYTKTRPRRRWQVLTPTRCDASPAGSYRQKLHDCGHEDRHAGARSRNRHLESAEVRRTIGPTSGPSWHQRLLVTA